MQVVVCTYSSYDNGYVTDGVAEVFASLDAYILWLHVQMRWPDIQYIDGKGIGTRLVTDFSKTSYTTYTAQRKEVIT